MSELENDKSKIERLRDALYSRKIKIKPSFVLDLHGHKTTAPDKWQKPPEESAPQVQKKPTDFSKKIFWFATAFFVVSIVIAGYVYLIGGNVISPNKIKIDIVGPTSIKAGEETVLDVSITNSNDTTLELSDLLLEYPSGTRSASDAITPLPHDRVSFGDIKPHQTEHRTIKAVFFGEEGKPIHVDISLEYKIPNSMSVFSKDVAYDALIGSSPITIAVDSLKEVNANQNYELTVTITSNSQNIEKDIILSAALPFGFDPISYSPEPTAKTLSWNLGDIESSGKRVITIKGKMYGEHNEERFFKFLAGTKSDKNPNTIGATIASVTQTVIVKEPFIAVALFLEDKNSDNYIVSAGSSIHSFIDLTNNLNVPVYDIVVETKVDGAIVDASAIKPDAGFYDSNTGIMRWSKLYNKDLASVSPKDTVRLTFSLQTFAPSSAQASVINSPKFVLDVTVKGKRRLESGVPEDIISTVRKTVKIASAATFNSQIVHTIGPIENQGNIPPKVGENTDYTIMWAVNNTFNPLSGAKVTATIPDYVKWNGVVSPAGEMVTYNSDSREITWNLGNVYAQSAKKPAVRQVAFQVGFVPSLSQVGKAPQIIDVATFTANDTFANISVSDTEGGLTTELRTDPNYQYGNEKVEQ